MRIFILENHADTLECFRVYLQSLGHEVFSATTLNEALEKLPKTKCDVLFSDIGLPDGTGWDLVAELKDSIPKYAVAMSGFGMVEDRAKSLATGFRHHLLKPVSPETVEKLLCEAEAEL